MSLTLDQGTGLCRLLADPTRLRLQWLLEENELTVAELTQVTGLAQSRVSTHLAKLKRAGLIQQQRSAGAAYYSANPEPKGVAAKVWGLLRNELDDAVVRSDRERAEQVVRSRQGGQTWAESVAGRMERHYSPGRTWEATARALIGLTELGDVLDIACGDGVLVELLAPRARSVTGVDISPTLLDAARKRLGGQRRVKLIEADMHALPLDAGCYDQVFLMHALTYTKKPRAVIAEAARLLRTSGKLVVTALNAHQHEATVQSYDHLNLGVRVASLRRMLEAEGLAVQSCRVTSQEDRPPYFEVITALATKR